MRRVFQALVVLSVLAAVMIAFDGDVRLVVLLFVMGTCLLSLAVIALHGGETPNARRDEYPKRYWGEVVTYIVGCAVFWTLGVVRLL